MPAPILTSSRRWSSRSSKIVSWMVETPSAWVMRTESGAWKSVAKPGYGSVWTSTASQRCPSAARMRELAAAGIGLVGDAHPLADLEECAEVRGVDAAQR